MTPVSGRELARIKGVSAPAVIQARDAGKFSTMEDGRYDADDPLIMAWQPKTVKGVNVESEKKNDRFSPRKVVEVVVGEPVETETVIVYETTKLEKEIEDKAAFLNPDECAAMVGITLEDLCADPRKALHYRRGRAKMRKFWWDMANAYLLDKLTVTAPDGSTVEATPDKASLALTLIKHDRIAAPISLLPKAETVDKPIQVSVEVV